MPMLVMKAMNRHESSYPPVLSSCRTSVGLYLASNHVIAINPPIGSVMIVSCAGASPAKFLRKVMGEGGGGRVYSLATRAIDRPSDRAIERPSDRVIEQANGIKECRQAFRNIPKVRLEFICIIYNMYLVCIYIYVYMGV